MAAWIKTFPREEELNAFIETVEPELRREVRSSVVALYDDANAFLEAWREPIGMDGLEIFRQALRPHLETRHGWMGEPGWGAIASYIGWYIWHEGY